MSKNSSDNWVVNQAIRLLEKYPLCDACLGRSFAKLGRGLSNDERGRAIKISIMMELDRKIKDHQLKDLDEISEILFNMKSVGKSLHDQYLKSQFQSRPCYLCNDVLSEVKEDFFSKALTILKERRLRYVLGVKLSSRVQELEMDFAISNGLVYYESMKAEIRRDVGKRLSALGFEPEIDNPEAELIYDLDSRTVEVITKSKRVLYLFTRLSRGVPISSWYSKQGDSLDKEIEKKIIVPFIEPSDVRIMDPYPLIIEDMEKDEMEVLGYKLLKVSNLNKSEFRLIMQTKPLSKVYRITFYSEEKIGHEIYEGVQDMLVEAKSLEEAMLKIKDLNLQVISVDLLKAEGKHERIRALLNRRE
ncbi:MAG: pseudouridylate synthase [Metallosphaera sp.]